MQSHFFSGNSLDRSSTLRKTASIENSSPQKILIFNNGDPLFEKNDGPATLKYSSYDTLKNFIVSKPPTVFLGVDKITKVSYFALDASNLKTLVNHLETEGEFKAFRPTVFSLPKLEGAFVGHSRALLDWNASNIFCSLCGGETTSIEGGHKRKCESEDCLTHKGVRNVSFPRTDPVVITAVVSQDKKKILLGRQSIWPKNMYSCIAGFCEPGERFKFKYLKSTECLFSLEEACAREVQEETNVQIKNVQYQSSQPWPFPSQLIFGCIAEAETEEILLIDEELEDAKWFPIEEVNLAIQKKNLNLTVPNTYSISFKLINTCVENFTNLQNKL
ncbi:Peroxisomal NADH pyrophosphatase nudt12 [Lobulomyces angularis]|nr:Peroxisomal NADH pyrophosphatase nudt12 [Lobulomyces angularis]